MNNQSEQFPAQFESKQVKRLQRKSRPIVQTVERSIEKPVSLRSAAVSSRLAPNVLSIIDQNGRCVMELSRC